MAASGLLTSFPPEYLAHSNSKAIGESPCDRRKPKVCEKTRPRKVCEPEQVFEGNVALIETVSQGPTAIHVPVNIVERGGSGPGEHRHCEEEDAERKRKPFALGFKGTLHRSRRNVNGRVRGTSPHVPPRCTPGSLHSRLHVSG
jgi:hypothetical protein